MLFPLYYFLMLYHMIQDLRVRQNGEVDHYEVIANLIIMSWMSYSKGLQLPIKHLKFAL